MKSKLKKWLTFAVRWGIAVAGITWVLANTSFQDRLLILNPATKRPVSVRVLNEAKESDARFQVVDPEATSRQTAHWVDRSEVWTRPDKRSVVIGSQKFKLLAVLPSPQAGAQVPAQLDVEDPTSKEARIVSPAEVTGGYAVSVPYPLVDIGLIRLVRAANPLYFLLAMLVLPISYFITARRWHMLLGTLEIYMGQGRTFVLNMVGAFYNTFMPGSTGGDLIKAWYASKHTIWRTRAFMSVIIDRALGLIALIILGGVMASFKLDLVDCRRVALLCGACIAATVAGLLVFYQPTLRKITGFDFILARLPMQKQINNAVEAMNLYARKPLVPLWAVVMTFPVHITSIVSAYFAGKAFGLSLPFFYYWVITPVISLVGALPLAPQGAGVMEFFAIELTKRQGVTVGQAFALAMSIRFGQMLWNLVAGIFVLRGGYHAPTQEEQEGLDSGPGAPAAVDSPPRNPEIAAA